LIDVDTITDEDGIIYLERILEEYNVKTKIKYRTPNGYHYVTTPFDPLLFTAHDVYGCMPCEIKKDALILLDIIEE
jgi:hypothetical protein